MTLAGALFTTDAARTSRYGAARAVSFSSWPCLWKESSCTGTASLACCAHRLSSTKHTARTQHTYTHARRRLLVRVYSTPPLLDNTSRPETASSYHGGGGSAQQPLITARREAKSGTSGSSSRTTAGRGVNMLHELRGLRNSLP